MSQTKISSFFQSPLRESGNKQKRPRFDSEPESENKKLKTTTNSVEVSGENLDGQLGPEKTELSESDKIKIEQKKMAAKLKLMSSKTNGLVTNFGLSWLRALEPEFSKEYFVQLSQFVATERKKATVYPTPEQVFTWTRACNISNVKVVIIGQDPYHGPRQAHGLCFSVLPGVKPPPSLENMYKELQNDIVGFKHPGHGNLIGWAQQGVLLLNACLTVRASQANSHSGHGWEKFTDAVIQWLNSNLTGVVFMLWGAYAQKKGACINKKRHHVLTTVHPSPLSAHRGFFGSKQFSQCNKFLNADGKPMIDWTHLPRDEEV